MGRFYRPRQIASIRPTCDCWPDSEIPMSSRSFRKPANFRPGEGFARFRKLVIPFCPGAYRKTLPEGRNSSVS
jgi:hypothetical protein